MTEKHTFDCTPRESRRIAENLRYTAAARELLKRATYVGNLWDSGRLTLASNVNVNDMDELVQAAIAFRITADE